MRQQQIRWLVNYYFDKSPETFAPSNSQMESEFIAEFCELSERLWKDRVREAAKKIGLSARRIPNAEAAYRPAGEPSFFIVYS